MRLWGTYKNKYVFRQWFVYTNNKNLILNTRAIRTFYSNGTHPFGFVDIGTYICPVRRQQSVLFYYSLLRYDKRTVETFCIRKSLLSPPSPPLLMNTLRSEDGVSWQDMGTGTITTDQVPGDDIVSGRFTSSTIYVYVGCVLPIDRRYFYRTYVQRVQERKYYFIFTYLVLR